MDDKANLAEKIGLLDQPYSLTIQLRDRDVELSEGELFVVPRGVEHCPKADEEAHVLLIEPRGTRNTGDAGGERTAEEVEI
jgi:mannose-6-phosphate isomerase-like protein (cupin superfamily)